MALMAQARCLNKAGRAQDAIKLLASTGANSRYRNSVDAQGRLILPNALLFALQLMRGPAHPQFQKTAMLLVERLNDYRLPMPPSQRRFLMQQVQELWPAGASSPTFAAEEMAAEFSASKTARATPGQMQPAGIPDVWLYQASDKSAVALFRLDRLMESMKAAVQKEEMAPDIRLSVLAPGASSTAFLKTEIGELFPSWQLALSLGGSDPFVSVSYRRIAIYAWTGILMTAGIVLLSVVMVGYLTNQVRLTRLRNDLIATLQLTTAASPPGASPARVALLRFSCLQPE